MVPCIFFHFFLSSFFSDSAESDFFPRPFNLQRITAAPMSLFFYENGLLCSFTTDTRSNPMISSAIANDLKQPLFYLFIFTRRGTWASACAAAIKGGGKGCGSSKFAWRWAISWAAEYITITWLKYCCSFFLSFFCWIKHEHLRLLFRCSIMIHLFAGWNIRGGTCAISLWFPCKQKYYAALIFFHPPPKKKWEPLQQHYSLLCFCK